MIKVSYYALADDASSWYRSQGVFPFIGDKRISFTDISHLNPGSWATITPYDIIIFQRFFNRDHVDIIQQAKIMGKRVVLDIDDDFLNLPEHHPVYEPYRLNAKYSMQCIRLADEVWVSTLALKQEYEKFNTNIHVIPNGWNDKIVKTVPFNAKNKTVFYRGGSTHRMDLYRHKPDLVLTAGECPDWNFVYFGISGDHEFFEDNANNNNVAFTNKVPLIQYFNELGNINPMIMINPLEDIKLNRSKSNISFVEGTLAGAAFFGNKSLPEFNKPCILDFSDFINGSQRYMGELANPAMLKHYQEQSMKHISENYRLTDINQERINRILA